MGSWMRSALAGFVGYFTFAAGWMAAALPFDGRLTFHFGNAAANFVGDLLDGLLLGALGIVNILGLVFLIPALLWARLQLWWLAQTGLERPGPSVMIGLILGLVVGYGFDLLIEPGHLFGTLVAGAIAGGLAGWVLVAPERRPSQRI